jgi:hypothetical protein
MRQRVRPRRILPDALVRLFRFPVVTATGVFTTYTATRLIRLLPLNGLFDVAVPYTGFGFLITACLVALAALKNTRIEAEIPRSCGKYRETFSQPRQSQVWH